VSFILYIMFAVCLVSKIDVIPATHNTMISQGNIDRKFKTF